MLECKGSTTHELPQVLQSSIADSQFVLADIVPNETEIIHQFDHLCFEGSELGRRADAQEITKRNIFLSGKLGMLCKFSHELLYAEFAEQN